MCQSETSPLTHSRFSALSCCSRQYTSGPFFRATQPVKTRVGGPALHPQQACAASATDRRQVSGRPTTGQRQAGAKSAAGRCQISDRPAPGQQQTDARSAAGRCGFRGKAEAGVPSRRPHSFMLSPIRFFFTSTLRTFTSTMSPTLTTSSGCFTNFLSVSCEICTSPSW